MVGLGVSLRPLLLDRGSWMVCYGMGELSECERLRISMWGGFGGESRLAGSYWQLITTCICATLSE